eukprot:GHRQ01034635.1.p1 GENE.GHRQ01034635.1~~GHRQ01034635.1.p1  ORF type:complete len:108 (+),score=19.61 GHRQ01034635.1:211-534(+)
MHPAPHPVLSLSSCTASGRRTPPIVLMPSARAALISMRPSVLPAAVMSRYCPGCTAATSNRPTTVMQLTWKQPIGVRVGRCEQQAAGGRHSLQHIAPAGCPLADPQV